MDGLLFLNGKPPSERLLKGLDYRGNFVVCADGAYNYLAKHCVPDILVGDFDSIKKHSKCNFSELSKDGLPKSIKAEKIIKLETEKDFTDGHVAMLELLKKTPDKIYIYGALNGDPDHEFSNYSLLYLAASHGSSAVIVTERFKIYFVHADFCGDFCGNIKKSKRVSVVPFTDEAHILESKGLKYSIFDEVFNRLHIKGVSNVSLGGEIALRLKRGAVLIFVEN